MTRSAPSFLSRGRPRPEMRVFLFLLVPMFSPRHWSVVRSVAIFSSIQVSGIKTEVPETSRVLS